MLRIGIVGTGLIAWAHGLGLQAMIDGGVIDASIAVVHDRSRANGPRASPPPSGPRWPGAWRR